ncbi:MAG: N-6 DNA methylase [Bacilli bacterium]|nr:N-6 DNA methylase [Bacilli bacterium]
MRDPKKIDLYTGEMEKACLILHEALQLDFFDSLIRAGQDLLDEIDDEGLEPETVTRLESIYHRLRQETFLNEEVRLSMELLIVKAFKHQNRYPLSLMTPDAINYLFAYFVGKLSIPNRVVLDMALGTGNLLTAVTNYLAHPIQLVGIEKDNKLAALARLNFDLQGNNVEIFVNNCLDPILVSAQMIIGDLDTGKGTSYFPYQVVLQALKHLDDQGFFIFMIDNDFFNQPDIQAFREQFTGTMLGIIVLPETLFQNNIIGKSILIGCKRHLATYEMVAMNLPGLNDTEQLNKTIDDLDQWIKQLKGMII